MSDLNPMLAYMTPDQRRRESNRMMAEQYNRPTPQDGPVVDRAGLLPLGTYANGQTGLAFPGFVAQPVEAFNRLLQRGYQGGTGDTQGVQDAFDVAGGAMVGGLAAPRPRNSLGALSSLIERQIHEAKALANPAKDRLSIPVTTLENNGEFSISSPTGNMFGSIDTDGSVNIWGSGLDKSSYKGRGYGAALYDEAARLAKLEGGVFKSDTNVSPDAQRMYNRLSRIYDVKRNDAGTIDPDGYIRSDTAPIFTVRVPASGRLTPPPLPPFADTMRQGD